MFVGCQCRFAGSHNNVKSVFRSSLKSSTLTFTSNVEASKFGYKSLPEKKIPITGARLSQNPSL